MSTSIHAVENKVHGNPFYDLKLSSVGPANVTESGVTYEPTNVDLAMKLHYLLGLYFFPKEAVEGLTVFNIKEPMFTLFNSFNMYCGRFRRSDESSRRPYVKCNDGGVRIIEAKCKYTIDECLEMKDCSLHKLLVYNQVLGTPELAISPPILIQFTWFKCGGMSIGLSWAHVLGDAFLASHLINSWGQLISTGHPPHNLQKLEPKTIMEGKRSFVDLQPLSKRVDSVGDYWKFVNNCNMITFCFQINAAKLENILLKISGQCETRQIPSFECLSAIIWKTLAKIRTEAEPRVITVCRNRSYQINNVHSGNNQIFGTVKAECQVKDANPSDLAALMLDQTTHEESQIDQVIEKDGDLSDFVVYGANLTFIDLEESEIYELELKGHKPVFANYMVEGVAESGLVLVLPGQSKGRTVTATLPENEMLQLRAELEKEWCIV
ncbi:hypothetical protein MKW98_028220 [Papaver atlanticum]|uniref:Uncharacterized protein n=1 Tax=Papaver atlanticum TaxID=357466 RepID=A0AAD4SXW8_9MAGN|nr:hypothetical protein MKW98_028220 [Papaver atlanticum]